MPGGIGEGRNPKTPCAYMEPQGKMASNQHERSFQGSNFACRNAPEP